MCGIAGVMPRRGRPLDQGVLDRLEAAITHRGPDSSGRYVRDEIALIDTRLAIVDVDHGQQPLYGPQGAVLVANGEIYNAPELRAQLGEARFKTLSDCEPPVHLYESVGLDYAEALRGMYALAIYDPALERLVLSRDRYGIKPLYVIETPDLFAFASEPQALIKAGLASAIVDGDRRAELLQQKFVTGAQTIFRGIQRVLPGETVVIQDARIVERRRVAATPARGLATGRAEALRAFDDTMRDSVAVHLRTDVPYGLFLSGGVDSSILLAFMQELSQTPIQALTLGYSGQHPSDESWAAMRTAEAAGARCRRIEMTPEHFWRLSPRICAAIDDPTTDTAVLPTYLLGQAAAEQGLKVTLCGEGADELFAGYSRYRRAALPDLRLRPKRRLRGVFSQTAGLSDRFGRWDERMTEARAKERQAGSSRLRTLLAVDAAERLPNSLLIKLDRCLMANSVEGRTPFLDPRVKAFADGLPDKLKVSLRYGKVLLREWLSVHLPAAQPYARKKGFNAPVGAWMAERSSELAAGVQRQPAIAELFGPSSVQAVFAEASTRPQPAWSLLFYALWHSHHVLGVPCEGNTGEVLAQAARG